MAVAQARCHHKGESCGRMGRQELRGPASQTLGTEVQVSSLGCKDTVGVTSTSLLFTDMKCGTSSLPMKGSEAKRTASASCSFWVVAVTVLEMLSLLLFKCV